MEHIQAESRGDMEQHSDTEREKKFPVGERMRKWPLTLLPLRPTYADCPKCHSSEEQYEVRSKTDRYDDGDIFCTRCEIKIGPYRLPRLR